MYYYNARYYDPELCIFITPDTIVQNPYDPQSLNRYSYCRSNPIIYADPDGHFFWIPLIGAAIGGIVGGTHGHPFSGEAWSNFDWRACGIGAASGAVGGAAGWAAGAGIGALGAGGLGLAGDILIGAGAGAAAGGSGYSVSAWMTGSPWRGNEFLYSMGIGGAIGGAAGGLFSPHLMPFLRGQETFFGQARYIENITIETRYYPTESVEYPERQAYNALNTDVGNRGRQILDVWPDSAGAMDEALGIQGTRIPDGINTVGRNKVIWQPSDNIKITYEQHPYHQYKHMNSHWHLDTPGNKHQIYIPGDPISRIKK